MCADVLSRLDNNLIYFDMSWPSGVSVNFDGMPFVVAGSKVFHCAAGPARKRKEVSNEPHVC